MSTHIFFLHVTKELTSTHVFYTIFSRKLIFKPHVFYMFQRNWYQRTSSFYIVRRKWFWKHILFLHVPKELISTYIFFLDSLCSRKRPIFYTMCFEEIDVHCFLHVQKDFLFNTHLLSTCSKQIGFESTFSIIIDYFQKKWFQRTSSFYMLPKELISTHVCFLQFSNGLLSTNMFFLSIPGKNKCNAHLVSTFPHIFFLHVPKELIFNAHLLSTLS